MLFTLFIIGLLGTFAFRGVRMVGDSNLIRNRCCNDDIIDILRFRQKAQASSRKIIVPQIQPENTWLEGEVPWIFNKNETDNDNISVTSIPPPFDPLEPCSIGHLFI
jgi:hypothetical protein